MTSISRRSLLGRAGLLAGAGVAGGVLAGCSTDSAPPPPVVDFRGAHQAGIDTAAQDRLAFAAFDVVPGSTRADLVALLTTWSAAAEAMTAGRPVPGDNEDQNSPPADTGEAFDLAPGNLTVTVGFGPGLFDARFGLADRRPAELAVLPALPGDTLDPAISGGDLAIQACSEDPQVAFHAVRNLARLGRGTVVTRWTQLGFGRTSSTSTAQATPRNLMGFKDGTRNLKVEDPAAVTRSVWVAPADAPGPAAWFAGGSFLVSRRIRMIIETWDRDVLSDQENVFGRSKAAGAPLSGGDEFTPPDFAKTLASGLPAIPLDAHVRLAAPENNNGTAILRRSYSFTDGVDQTTGMLDAGLFFIAFMRSPTQFTTLQTQLGARDALNEYIRHTSSAVFACPPGVAPGNAGDYWGRALLEG
ncbi:iron uptake transporter deferrochelatase/peroxidase subunit [Actinomycetospora sp.]|jgi:deferrochelatase/peroxidase EfeB|uniref:iron uptake transporter deferrochelatase/peroxidase subunit n=1 Tax=Actinomycetospora sp. TaxID=1872135 RepID=UPI002F413A0E